MKGIPPEIDQLMWTVAEQESPAAADEFLTRYPIYREELMRRRDTVSGLKKGRPAQVPVARAMPRFTPKEAKRPSPAPRQIAVVSGLVLAALAAASYTITAMLSPTPVPERTVLPSNPPAVQRTDPPKVETPPVTAPPVDSGGSQGEDTNKPAETPKYLQPQSLVVKKANLPDVLQMLGAQAGVKIVIAPGLPTPTVSVEYHDMNAVEMLRDLGERYKFTAFDQGDGSIVVYPVVDQSGDTGTANLRPLGG